MTRVADNRLPQLLRDQEQTILADWTRALAGTAWSRDPDLHNHTRRFIDALRQTLDAGAPEDLDSPAWGDMRALLDEVSRTRARQRFTPSETATFVLSFKEPLFARLRATYGADPDALADAVWSATTLIDRLGLYTTDAHLRTREEIITRQQQELLELSTPVVTLWHGILAVPLIGTLDSARTQVVMETLLERVVDSGARIAIIDITGVPTVDTLVAQHLLKTVAAARLMGADCIISGIRPQIAQTIVHLGVNLGDIVTKATLADALAVALGRSGLVVSRPQPAAAS